MALIPKVVAVFTVTAALFTSTANADALIKKFTVDKVKAILTSAGAQDVTSKTTSGLDVVSFSSGELKHVGVLTVCSKDGSGCLGLQLLTGWDSGGSVPYQTLNSFNYQVPFGSAFIDPDKTLVYNRYIICDGGVSDENVRINIANFVVGSKKLLQFMLDSQKVASVTPNSSQTALLSFSPTPDISSAVRAAMTASTVNRFTASSRPSSIRGYAVH